MTTLSPSEVIASLKKRLNMSADKELNEASTRLLFINEMLSGVLGWDVEDFNPEEYAPSIEHDLGKSKKEWLDYHLHSGESLKLVLEAKRAGTTFQLQQTKKIRVQNLQTLMKNHGKPLREALKQAKNYCVRVGTQSFVVTNGFQWIASVAFAHNVPEKDLYAIVYYDLDDIEGNLNEFVELLSPNGIAAQILMRRASCDNRAVKAPPFARSLNLATNSPNISNKNYLIRPLTLLMHSCFGDLTNEEHQKMLAECYVTSNVNDEYVRQLESFVDNNYSEDFASADRVNRSRADASIFGSNGTAVLLVGRVGSGKSTFLAMTRERLRGINQNDTKVVWLYIDLYTRIQLHANQFNHERFVDEICNEVLHRAESEYPHLNPYDFALLEQIFSNEIRRYRSSRSESLRVSSSTEEGIAKLISEHLDKPLYFLRAYLGFLNRRGLPVTVVFDNVDRGTESFEKATFQLAQNLALNTGATVVTTLRETTYYNGKNQGFLDVGRHVVFTINAPSFAEVVKRRFDYVRNSLRTDPALFKKLQIALAGSPLERLFDFAEIISEVILDADGEVRNMIQSVAGTDVRRALDLLEDFATSPTTDLDYLFQTYENRQNHSGRETMSVRFYDSFIRSVMIGRHARYAEKTSKIANLFQASTTSLASHLTAVRILQFLSMQATHSRASQDVLVRSLVEHLGALGYNVSEVVDVINHLGRFGLILSLTHPEPPWAMEDAIRLGSSGRYYIEKLIYSREYIRQVLNDTILYEEAIVESLLTLEKDFSLPYSKRVEDKALFFLAHLARQEEREMASANAASRPSWCVPIVEKIGIQHFGVQFRESVKVPPQRRKGRGV